MSPNKQALSRRELLKAMTALGGAVAASSMLPGKWAKPEVGVGALPAHAQSTCMPPYAFDHCVIDAEVDIDNEVDSPEGIVITGTTSAWITPPCPGIELTLKLEASVPQPVKPDVPSPIIVTTDSEGKVTFKFKFTLNPASPSSLASYIKATWSFAQPEDGSGSCEAVHTFNGVTNN